MKRMHQALNTSISNIQQWMMNVMFRRVVLAGTFAGVMMLSYNSFTQKALSVASCHNGKNINIVAHQDDDILFLSPDLLNDIDDGACVRTVYVTAGDDGRNASYWTKREDGAKAAYALMADSDNSWTDTTIATTTGLAQMSVLKNDPRISLVFMRLPDGDHNGSGFKINGRQSLEKLWDGTIPEVRTVDQSTTYTKDDLIATLADLIKTYAPDTVNTQNYAGGYDDGDHSDHHAVAYLTKVAQDEYQRPHNFVGYEDYTISYKPANVSNEAYLRKQQAFFAYAAYDPHVCDTEAACSHLGYGSWLPRQYTLPYTIKGAALSGIATITNTIRMVPTSFYASLQGGIAEAHMPISARIGLAERDRTPVANRTQTPTPKQFHLPFVGLDVPQLTDARSRESFDVYVSPQPVVVIRGWMSDNELSEATTSTV